VCSKLFLDSCVIACDIYLSLLFELIFQALDTLGNTRWRVNKRVLSVVDRIWSNGGCLADLVDHSDVSIFHSFFLETPLPLPLCSKN
jgi:DNA-directed RNA polymerase